ncbi:MAG: carbohydrate-binding family 9-like protein [Planctomycetota bacterium]
MKTLLGKRLGWAVVCLMGMGLASCEAPFLKDLPKFGQGTASKGPAVKEPARLVAGPYVSSHAPRRATLCYAASRPLPGGVRLTGQGLNLVQRVGRPSAFQAVSFDDLAPGTSYRAELLIPGGGGESFSFQTLPEGDEPIEIALICGGAAAPESLAAALDTVSARAPDAIVLLGSQVTQPDARGAWIEEFFAPNRKALAGKNLLHAPDEGFPAVEEVQALFPASPSGGSNSMRLGPLQLVFAAARELEPDRLLPFQEWLKRELASPAQWKILVVEGAPLASGAEGLDATLLEAIGPMAEEAGIDLVLSSRGAFYHRSLPVGQAGAGIRYLVLPKLAPAKEPPAASDFTAAQSGEPGVFLLRVKNGRLGGEMVSLGTKFADAFSLAPGERTRASEAGASFIDREGLVARKGLLLSQERELARVARQACRAVENPARPRALRVLVANPSPDELLGELLWQTEGTAFLVEPRQVAFRLEPGEASRSAFFLSPNPKGAGMPSLTVALENGLSATEELLLTELRVLSVPRTAEPCRPDGRIQEAFWKSAAPVGGFYGLQGAPDPEGAVQAYLAAGPEALYVRFRCALGGASLPEEPLSQADGDIWREESVEVFLDPRAEGREYYELSVSTANVPLDANDREGRSWSPEWGHGVEVEKDSYNVEMAIPYRALGYAAPPAAGEEWAVNLTRNRYQGGVCTVYQAAPTFGPNSRSGLYLRIRFE